MNKKIIISLLVITSTCYFYFQGDSKQEEVTSNDPQQKVNKKKSIIASIKNHLTLDSKINENKQDTGHNHNTIHDKKLKIEDLIIKIDRNEKTDNLKSVLTQFSTIDLENVTLKELTNKFDKIDIETELTVDRNEQTGNMFFLKSKSNIPGTRYLHGQIVGEGPRKFIQHLSFEYKSADKSFNEAITVAQSLIGTDQKPSVISPNYVQWKISETHILWVKKQSLEELLSDPIYPHTEDDLGTCKIAIEQEIH